MIGQQGIGRLIVTGTRKMALNVKTGGNPNVAGIDKSSATRKMVLNVNKGSNISVCMDKSRRYVTFLC